MEDAECLLRLEGPFLRSNSGESDHILITGQQKAGRSAVKMVFAETMKKSLEITWRLRIVEAVKINTVPSSDQEALLFSSIDWK